MPLRYAAGPVAPVEEAASAGPKPFRMRLANPLAEAPNPPAPDVAPDDSGPGWGSALLAGGGLAAMAALTHKPSRALLGTLATKLNNVRLQSMLSGFAVPKSILGNVGAAVNESLERGTMAPLKAFFSAETVKDFGRNYRSGGMAGPVPGHARVNGWLPSPGRILGAGDAATQAALIRGGDTAAEAETAVLQAPLSGSLHELFEDNPVMQYALPFRRTPWNQFIQGAKTMKAADKGGHRLIASGYGLAGAAEGARSSDEDFPIGIGLGTAASAKYGLPFALGALGGRMAAGSKTPGTATSQALPLSEYGWEQSFTNPLGPLDPEQSAAMRALKHLGF